MIAAIKTSGTKTRKNTKKVNVAILVRTLQNRRTSSRLFGIFDGAALFFVFFSRVAATTAA